MKFDILTIFPDFFISYKETGLIKNAIKNKIISLDAINIRDFARDKHRMTDDTPFGGGPGMVMKAEPILRSIKDSKRKNPQAPVVYLSPKGQLLDQTIVRELSQKKGLILLCTRYEGADERIMPALDMELSMGDYIISGGEPAAIVLIDAIARLIHGVMGNINSITEESFSNGLLEYPQYTRPEILPEDIVNEFNLSEKESRVPSILLQGHHSKINEWRLRQSLQLTKKKRPDLLRKRILTDKEKSLLDE